MTSDREVPTALIEFSMDEMLVLASTLQTLLQERPVKMTEYKYRLFNEIKVKLAIRYREMSEALEEDAT